MFCDPCARTGLSRVSGVAVGVYCKSAALIAPLLAAAVAWPGFVGCWMGLKRRPRPNSNQALITFFLLSLCCPRCPGLEEIHI